MKKKCLLLLCIFAALIFCLLPGTSAFADETEGDSDVSGNEAFDPNTANIYYELDGGYFDEDLEYATSFTFGEEVVIPTPKKVGYSFLGWVSLMDRDHYLDDINNAYVVDKPDIDEKYVKLFAIWEELNPITPEIDRISNPASGFLFVYFKPIESNAAGYEIEYAYSSDFTKKLKIKDTCYINGAVVLKRIRAEETCSIRARSYFIDSTGEKYYSPYSASQDFVVINGTVEMEPTPNSAVINSVTIEGGSVIVKAFVEDRIASYDDAYHLVKLDPVYGTVISSLATIEKDDEITVSYPVSGNLMSQVALAVKESEDSYYVISPGRFIDNPQALASYTAAYPTPASKKGRQGAYDTGMGDKHTFHNVYLEQLVGSPSSYDVAYNYNGKTYYFYTPTHHIDYNSLIKAANSNGGTVTMQLMIRWSSQASDLICPTGRTPGYNYYAFNMEEAAGREKVEALFMFLAEYWSKSGLHVDNWILGNEVNTFLNTTGRWYWAGNISRDAFMTNYSNTFRSLYYAVKSHNANARVFTCTDHTWNDRDRDWGTKGFITSLNSYLKNMNPNIQWNLANHAYTAVLTNADPWNDGAVRIYSVAHSNSASFVSPYNLEVLTNYVASNFGSNCRIILSEVGFSYTGGTNPTLNGGRQSGADVQAAATAYLFYKAQFTSNIDACIFHTGDEGEAGKNFRIEGMPAGTVYTYMDTPSYADYTNGYLGLIGGATSWESIIPGFNGAVLRSMPSR